jgi:Alkylmercury lyase
MAHPSADSQKVLHALMALHRAWPLEKRIMREACDSSRETYLAILTRWMRTASAPAPAGLDAESLDELLALDAIFLTEDEQAIGAAPFCPVPTDIAVRFPHEDLFALSALDALALPRILGSAGVIEARCPVSGQRISIQLDAQGNPMHDQLDNAVVVLRKISDHVQRYVLDLAPGIRFLHPSAAGEFPQRLSLAEAIAVAHAFYGFQRKLLNGQQ